MIKKIMRKSLRFFTEKICDFHRKFEIFMETIKIFIEKIIKKIIKKIIQRLPNRCERGSKAQCKKPANFHTSVSICQFPCPVMLLYRYRRNLKSAFARLAAAASRNFEDTVILNKRKICRSLFVILWRAAALFAAARLGR